MGLSHKLKRKPNGITKADRNARKSDDHLKRNFTSDAPLTKAVTDMTEIKCRDGKLYVSAVFDCYDLTVLGLAMDTNMRASLCVATLNNAVKAFPELRGAIIHSDRCAQYTGEIYHKMISKSGGTSSVIGTTGGSALLTRGFLLLLRGNITMIHWLKQHR